MSRLVSQQIRAIILKSISRNCWQFKAKEQLLQSWDLCIDISRSHTCAFISLQNESQVIINYKVWISLSCSNTKEGVRKMCVCKSAIWMSGFETNTYSILDQIFKTAIWSKIMCVWSPVICSSIIMQSSIAQGSKVLAGEEPQYRWSGRVPTTRAKVLQRFSGWLRVKQKFT